MWSEIREGERERVLGGKGGLCLGRKKKKRGEGKEKESRILALVVDFVCLCPTCAACACESVEREREEGSAKGLTWRSGWLFVVVWRRRRRRERKRERDLLKQFLLFAGGMWVDVAGQE